MGVPALFLWLLRKYPRMVRAISKGEPFSCSNLYLDMNGIIHPCCHPEGSAKPRNEAEMLDFMAMYIDMLLRWVHPSDLVFIAIDGPPPRAKMMQQRERRFIVAMESQRSMADSANQSTEEEKNWDSNVITPGTEFMSKVKSFLSTYIAKKISEMKKTKPGLKWVLSDSSVPGEGEHKILDFVRHTRYKAEDPQALGCRTTHVVFSNDADMIMLSLLLHESNVFIMRDIPMTRLQKAKLSLFDTSFQLVDLTVVSQYIAEELLPNPVKNELLMNYHSSRVTTEDVKKQKSPNGTISNNLFRSWIIDLFDPDRLIDDWSFLTYFVGNDFVPTVMWMNMRDGALEHLLAFYRAYLEQRWFEFVRSSPEFAIGYQCSGKKKLSKKQRRRLKSKVSEMSQRLFLVDGSEVNVKNLMSYLKVLCRDDAMLLRTRADHFLNDCAEYANHVGRDQKARMDRRKAMLPGMEHEKSKNDEKQSDDLSSMDNSNEVALVNALEKHVEKVKKKAHQTSVDMADNLS